MKFKNISFVFVCLFLIVVSLGSIQASEVNDNSTLTEDFNSQELSFEDSDEIVRDDGEEIIVNDWDDLQYYCSLSDKDYTLKLKEDTVYYPSSFTDQNKQIKINNNVRIVGNSGAYFGDITPDAGDYASSDSRYVTYTPIVVPDNSGISIALENVTFKWTHTLSQNAGLFIQLGGNGDYHFSNCLFEGNEAMGGSASIIHLIKGHMELDNCSFINCSVAKGIINVYSKQSVVMRNCYFAHNYAYEHSTCVMNWGNLLIYNSTFFKNRSQAWAAGITTYGDGNTTIYDSNFTGNVAGWNGGALYVYNIVNIYNTVFVDNNCTTNNGGGAIGACQFSGIPRLYVDKCLFRDNNNLCWALDELSTYGTGRGGAISFMDQGSIEVRNSLFICNSASMGTAICAIEAGSYGSPDIYIINNTFINHTRVGDVLMVKVIGTECVVLDNKYFGNSVEFSELSLSKVNISDDGAVLKINVGLVNPDYYESDILDRMLYDVYMNDKYVKTVNSTTFGIDFGDLDICSLYVIPTISNVRSNELILESTREYIFVSKSNGDDDNNGSLRSKPVKSIQKAIELAKDCRNIILLDGDFSESINCDYDLTLKGENGARLTNLSKFNSICQVSLKNLLISNLSSTLSAGNISVSNCIIQDNLKSTVFSASNVEIINSIILNNYNLVSADYVGIRDSVLLGSHIDAKNYNLDCNWWGSTLDNYQIRPFNGIGNWLVLNATSNIQDLEINQSALVDIAFYLFENDTSFKYDFRDIDLDLCATNGISFNSTKSNSKIEFQLVELSDGELTISYGSIKYAVKFNFIKSNPYIDVYCENIMVGDDLILMINVPDDLSGNLTVNVGDKSQSQVISNGLLMFNFSDLKAGSYDILVKCDGNEKYSDKEVSTSVIIYKYESFTSLYIGEIFVDEDLLLTVTTLGDATGNVTLKINNDIQTLILADARAFYTIKNITRGDYHVTAVYNGDDKYLSSSDSAFIEVDNLVSKLDVQVSDIIYGSPVTVEIVLNDNATGEVTAEIDGIVNSSIVKDGRVSIVLLGVEAGMNKGISVFYSGDDTYFNRTGSASFNIAKADLTFVISSNDIKIGQDAVVCIKVPPKTGGNFTINGDVIPIPLSGSIEYLIPDLEIGEYEIIAVYNGNNYRTIQNSTSFKVLEYPQDQWSNVGGDSQNTGKSKFNSSVNGGVLFVMPINETIVSDILIDSEGNIYLSTENALYSFDSKGVLRWNFTNDDVIGNFSGISMARNVIFIPKSGDTLFLVNQTTGERYGSSNIYQGSSVFSPIIDDNANVYVSSEYQVTSGSYKLVIVPFKLWEFGGSPTIINLGKNAPLTSPVANGDIIVMLTDSRLRVIDAKSLQTMFIKSGDYKPVRPIVNENIVYAVLGDYIVAYTLSGSQLWKTKVTGGASDKLILDSQKGLYATNSKGNLYCYDLTTGKESLISNLQITSGVLTDNQSSLYFACKNIFYKLDFNGNILWKSDLGSVIIGNPVIDSNGRIYVTSQNNEVIALTVHNLKETSLNVEIGNDDVIISVDKECSGTVTYTIDGTTYSEIIGQNIVLHDVSSLMEGCYEINVTYSGDARFMSKSMSFNFVKLNDDSVFSIDLPSDATGNLTVTIDNVTYIAELVNGRASVDVWELSAGIHNVSVVYSGDDKYSPIVKTKVIEVLSPKLTGSNVNMLYTANALYKVRLIQNNLPLAGKTITFTVNGKNIRATTDRNGYASIKISLAPNAYSVKATYRNFSLTKKVTVKSIIKAKNLNAKKSSKSIKIKVALKKVNKKYLKNKKVTLKFNKKTFKAKTNNKGVVTFTIKKNVYNKLKTNKKYTYQVIYAKDKVKKAIKFKK